jgi:predicted HAD superfamily hydrolase
LGDGVPVFREYLKEHIKTEYLYAPAHLNKQRAGAVATLGLQYFAAGRYETAEAHSPEYLRLSQAERERREKEKGQTV